MAKEKKDTRARNWMFIVYPDSAPENWRDILSEMHVPWIESPLHDKDTDEHGELKKPHWHIILLFPGNKSYSQIREITLSLNAPNPQKIANIKGMVRYLAHLDEKDKYAYNKADIKGYCGADPELYLRATFGERYELIREMKEYVKQNEIIEFADLFEYAAEERFDDWFPLLCDNSTFIMSNYIKSIRHRKK